ncbi:P-loop containing nucleoside triphosphate hydrolase protein [Cytidiella melzeri]|nr:P-loop containing nucleoside triphosphate hydrolase protein [Cytidiella melzeri]
MDTDDKMTVVGDVLSEPLDSEKSEVMIPDILRDTEEDSDNSQQRILSLPPPPSYDVIIDNLSIGIPPHKVYIPTPIPIPIPQSITDRLSRRKKVDDSASGQPAGDDRIIRNVNARIQAGEMMAIIGGSGSGKTTMLHAVANRLNGLPIVAGNVSFVPSTANDSGGRDTEGLLKKGMISNVVGFVRQHDYLLPHLTVRETLVSAARLRLPKSAHDYISEIVEQTIQELGLAACAETTVGGSGTTGQKGISGGEKRRLSIGCVLVSFPSVLILDEVTTGLDSFTAYHLLLTLSRLSRKGRTILISLHQPRSDAFYLFNSILLMSRGSVVYSGPTKESLTWFKALGHTPQERTNPLDFLIDVSSVDTRDEVEEREGRERVEKLVLAWNERQRTEVEKRGGEPLAVPEKKHHGWSGRMSGFGKHEDVEANAGAVADGPTPGKSSSVTKRHNTLQQTFILSPRSFKNMWRAFPELIGHFLQAIILGILMGITFYQLGSSPADIQSLKTLSFQVVPVYGYMSQVVWTYKWCTSMVVLDRELEDGLYKPFAWMASELLAWLPINIFGPFLYSVLVYFICNMRMDDLHYNFGVFVIDLIMIQISFVSWALFAASIERSFARASLLGNALSIFFLLSPGFFLVNVPGWIRWFRWISPYFFSFRIVVITQLRERDFACEGVTGPALSQCSGSNALRALRISPEQPIWPMFLGLLGFIVVVLFLSWLLLTLWKPGGVQHARKVSSDHHKGKEQSDPEIDIIRGRVDVVAENVKLFHVRRKLPSLEKVETPILTDVSARFPSGEVSVIMGPSGSGKSTFLRMCAGRPLKAGVLSSFEPQGKLLFNGVPASKRTRHICAFVEQDDNYHLPALTVRETLRYAAMIKLPSTISRKTKIARAEEVLKMLGLRDCANIMVGGELLKGISGGEKRRLSLACQMINDPAVLIVDEPTSGLDANTARNVMEALQDIARSGRTVIASLHQPRSDIYNMADNFTILAKQGNVVFHGPRDQLLPHFALAGYVCPPLYNPSDYCMDLISVDVRGAERLEASTARIRTLIDHWHNRHEKLAEFAATEHQVKGSTLQLEDRPEHTPIWIALPVVLERTLRNTWRQSDLFWTRWSQAPILAVCFYIFYLRLSKGPTGAQDRIGIIAECTSSLSFVGFLNLAATYPMEKTVFFYDYKSAGGRYSSATFIIAFTLFAFIPEFISALIFSVIMNVATGMRTSSRIYFEYSVVIWAQLNFGESIGIAFASFFDTMGLSVSLVSVFLTVASQSSSVFSASLAGFLDDIAWIFPMKYAARVLLVNEMRGLQFNCSPADIADGACTAVDGEQVLDLFGFQDVVPWRLTIACVALTVGYRIAAWAILSARMRFV